MMQYVITPDGQVRSYKTVSATKAAMAALSGSVAATDDNLSAIPSPLLVLLHNTIRPERPVKRFSDRATAEKRLKGVLEVLAKPGEEFPAPEGEVSEEGNRITITPSAKSEEGDDTMATKAKRTTRKTARKSGAERKPAPEITEAMVARVIKMRADGKTWEDICATLGQPAHFVLRVRPLMKKADKSSVRKSYTRG